MDGGQKLWGSRGCVIFLQKRQTVFHYSSTHQVRKMRCTKFDSTAKRHKISSRTGNPHILTGYEQLIIKHYVNISLKKNPVHVQGKWYYMMPRVQ